MSGFLLLPCIFWRLKEVCDVEFYFVMEDCNGVVMARWGVLVWSGEGCCWYPALELRQPHGLFHVHHSTGSSNANTSPTLIIPFQLSQRVCRQLAKSHVFQRKLIPVNLSAWWPVMSRLLRFRTWQLHYIVCGLIINSPPTSNVCIFSILYLVLRLLIACWNYDLSDGPLALTICFPI